MSIKPRCPYFGACGGCQLQDISYEEQLERKRDYIKQCLERQGLTGISIASPIGMNDPWFYRNKIQFPIRQQNDRLQMGYFKQRTHEVVNIKECYIQDPLLTEIAQIAREIFEKREISAYDEKTGKGILRHFIGRSTFQNDELLLGVVVNGRGLPAGFTIADEIKKKERLMMRLVSRHDDYPPEIAKKRIVGIIQNVNITQGNVILGTENTTLLGIPFMLEKLGGFSFKLQLLSFFQVNPVQAAKLYKVVRRFAELSGTEIVVDAYAGAGAISFYLADKAAEVVAIEERKEAARDAEKNVQLNNLHNIKVVAGMMEKAFPKKADIVILDPPRGGCSESGLKLVCRSGAKRVVYVSCNPQSLARDLRVLSDAGYNVELVQPVDMFPQTDHIEAVVKLQKSA